jgi:hypothetical protein
MAQLRAAVNKRHRCTRVYINDMPDLLVSEIGFREGGEYDAGRQINMI